MEKRKFKVGDKVKAICFLTGKISCTEISGVNYGVAGTVRFSLKGESLFYFEKELKLIENEEENLFPEI